MADNYLERRMEEYRAGKLAPKTRVVRSSTLKSKTEFTLDFPHLNVVVFGGPLSLVEAVVKCFRSVDSSVALCHGDTKVCSGLAQNTGCRYYPFNPYDASCRMSVIDDMVSRWGAVDVVIDLRDVVDGLQESDDALTNRAQDIAALMLVHSHPRFNGLAYVK